MSDDIVSHYKDEIQRLNHELEKTRKEAAAYRTDRSGKLKGAEATVAELQAELEKVRKEHATLTRKLEEAPGELKGELDRLKGEIRTRDHKSKFADLAKELKADPNAVDALWKLSEYQPDQDEVDVDRLKGVIEATLEKNPFLRAVADHPRTPLFQPGPGAGQGPKATNPAGSFTMTYEQGRDPQFMRLNRRTIADAAKNGLLTVTGGPDL